MEVGQFQPGRIHHSAPQIMLTIFMLASFVEGLDPKKARHAAIAGAIAALSLAIGLETLPFIVVLAALAVALLDFPRRLRCAGPSLISASVLGSRCR